MSGGTGGNTGKTPLAIPDSKAINRSVATETAPKRFWNEAAAAQVDGGWTVHLDGRPVKTPAKAAVLLPTRAAAELCVAEWAAQGERVDPNTMPSVRLAATAIDRIAPDPAPVVAEIAGFAETDLLCYRADDPPALVDAQTAQWTPVLDRIAERLGARPAVAEGIMPVAQPAALLEAVRTAVAAHGALELAALHGVVSDLGSVFLGLAVSDGAVTAEAAWAASLLDETHQEAEWGRDSEAFAKREALRADFEACAAFLAALRA